MRATLTWWSDPLRTTIVSSLQGSPTRAFGASTVVEASSLVCSTSTTSIASPSVQRKFSVNAAGRLTTSVDLSAAMGAGLSGSVRPKSLDVSTMIKINQIRSFSPKIIIAPFVHLLPG